MEQTNIRREVTPQERASCFLRRKIPTNPAAINAQVLGSGTAVVPVSKMSKFCKSKSGLVKTPPSQSAIGPVPAFGPTTSVESKDVKISLSLPSSGEFAERVIAKK